ncbi:MAG: hypothetical protein DDT30_00967 [Dehalococcoidia bacterium]|nr:hypothetical protein [candidate division NPL-UPA2 bacterium]MBT9140391.1 hypothetical protein [Bacillota bacterium]MBT9142137.1 hypothetical protein [Bacillota bacterium]
MFTSRLLNRYFITGEVALKTPLHIGSGKGDVETDSAVVRYLNGNPYVPGSSFKGVLRSTIERLAGALGYRTCCLDESSGSKCPTVDEEVQKGYLEMQERGEREEKLLEFLDKHLCDTCKAFGSPFAGSKVFVDDLGLKPDVHLDKREIRDGVGIDRDTGTAKGRVKFDYETVPADARFQMNIVAENATSQDLSLLAIALCEMQREGNLRLGGITSRGLGWGQLVDVQVRKIDFNGPPAVVREALLGDWRTLPAEGGADFVKEHLKTKEAPKPC